MKNPLNNVKSVNITWSGLMIISLSLVGVAKGLQGVTVKKSHVG